MGDTWSGSSVSNTFGRDCSFESFNVYRISKLWNFENWLSTLLHFRRTNFFVSSRLMLLLYRLTHYAATKDNKSVKTSNKLKNSNLHSCENLTSEHSSTRKNSWQTVRANSVFHSRITTIPCAFGPVPLPQFLAFRYWKHFQGPYNVTISRLESCLRSLASGSLTAAATRRPIYVV